MTYVSEIGASTPPSMTDALGGKSMGKEDFLKLLVTQLQHQDPLNPSDPTEFTAQLSQFSSLEQLFTVNKNLAELASSSGETQKLSALSMIGADVVSKGNKFELNSNGSADIGYRLEHDATEVNLYVQDDFGRTVATIEGDNSTGEHFYNWDGTDSLGQIVPPGKYNLVVRANGPDDEIIEASAMIKGRVSGVDLNDKEPILVTSAGEFSLGNITTVSTN